LANSVLRRGGVAGVELISQLAPGPAVSFRSFADDAAEASAVAAQVAELVGQGMEPAAMAVLYRTNGQSEPVENSLAAAGIAYQVRGGERFFSRPEIRRAMVGLRQLAQQVDGPPLEPIKMVLGGLGWSQEAPGSRGAVREAWESLDALASLATELVAAGATTVGEVVEAIEERFESGYTPAASGVTLASLHAAKGLEWNVVFLIGLADGLVPISLASTPAEVAEERRLLYVGLTRAKTDLRLSYAKARTVGASASRRPSQFLAGLWPNAGRAKKEARGVFVPDQADLNAAERQRFERLAQWRRTTARLAARPAFAILTDLTLRALAVRVPATAQELTQVPGIGPVKAELYGDALLALLADDPA
jgi:DNA helicase-2/ATP-dependent DNA helicase PcrA